jgi:imidazolonepropionase-like amidohydrolase
MKTNIYTAETLRRRDLFLKLKSSLCLFCFALYFGISAVNISAQIAVKGETVYTMAGEPIANGVVLLNDGKITAVGPAASISIPADYRVISAKVVTPGLIDAHTVIGLNGYLNQPHDQMALDGGASFQPELRATDSYNAEEKLIEVVRRYGVTTIHTGHQPGALASGQTMIAKTVGKNVDEATMVATAMIAVSLGPNANATGRSPGTRAKQASMLRAELIKAQENEAKTEKPRDLKSQIMARVIKREIPLLITAEAAQDIMTALRIAKEFNIKIVLDGAADGHLIANEIKASGFPVIVHPTMARPGGERANLSLENASKLRSAGIPIALQSGFEGYVPKTRIVLFEAGMAAANGLGMRNALASITIDAARILGIDNRVGSIAVGKDADIAMYDGDPFEWTSHCTGVVINGKLVSEIVK